MSSRPLALFSAIARQGVLLVAVFLLTSTALFLAVRAVPGDPIALRLKNPDPVRVAAERARLGLDDAWPVQWWRYLRSFATGDWGRSFTTGRAVREDVAEFLPATIELSVAALGLGLVAGVALALCAEMLQVEFWRRLAGVLGALGLTVPIFWIGLLALVAGASWLGWFPSSGRLDPALLPPAPRTGFLTVDALLAGDVTAGLDAVRHLALPAGCLSLFQAAYICAILQGRLRDPRVRTLLLALRARGLGRVRIWLGHVLRVVSPPVVTIIGTNFGALLGGAVLTETVFSWPGLGSWLVEAVKNRDLFVVENVLLLLVLLVTAVVFGADLLARLINPVATRDEEGPA